MTSPHPDTCPVEGCGQPTAAWPGAMRFPACPHHWFLVPFPYRLAVADALRQGDMAAYQKAVASLARAAHDLEAPCPE